MRHHCVSRTKPLDLLAPTLVPLMGMAYRTGTPHVQIDLDQALDKVTVRLDSRRAQLRRFFELDPLHDNGE